MPSLPQSSLTAAGQVRHSAPISGGPLVTTSTPDTTATVRRRYRLRGDDVLSIDHRQLSGADTDRSSSCRTVRSAVPLLTAITVTGMTTDQVAHSWRTSGDHTVLSKPSVGVSVIREGKENVLVLWLRSAAWHRGL